MGDQVAIANLSIAESNKSRAKAHPKCDTDFNHELATACRNRSRATNRPRFRLSLDFCGRTRQQSGIPRHRTDMRVAPLNVDLLSGGCLSNPAAVGWRII